VAFGASMEARAGICQEFLAASPEADLLMQTLLGLHQENLTLQEKVAFLDEEVNALQRAVYRPPFVQEMPPIGFITSEADLNARKRDQRIRDLNPRSTPPQIGFQFTARETTRRSVRGIAWLQEGETKSQNLKRFRELSEEVMGRIGPRREEELVLMQGQMAQILPYLISREGESAQALFSRYQASLMEIVSQMDPREFTTNDPHVNLAVYWVSDLNIQLVQALAKTLNESPETGLDVISPLIEDFIVILDGITQNPLNLYEFNASRVLGFLEEVQGSKDPKSTLLKWRELDLL